MSRCYMPFIIQGILLLLMCINIGSSEAKKLIDRSKVWHYRDDMIAGGGCVEYEMQFGNDTVLDVNTYTIFSTSKQIYIAEEGGRYIEKDLGAAKTLYPLREDNGVVYMHKPIYLGDKNLSSNWPYAEQECVMYDFGISPGTQYKSVGAALIPMNMKLISLWNWKDAEQTRCIQQMEACVDMHGKRLSKYIAIVEGIGPGTEDMGINLVEINWIYPGGPLPLGDNYPSCSPFGKLVKVADKDDNLIFTPDMLAAMDEISLTDLSSGENDLLYDLMGIPVDTPQPGTIYIRNGKKIVLPINRWS